MKDCIKALFVAFSVVVLPAIATFALIIVTIRALLGGS